MDKAIDELKKLVKKDYPLSIIRDPSGNITEVSYEKTWKVGGTTPVLDDSGAVIDYKEDYEEQSLTSSDIKAIETWIKDNIVSS